MSTTDENFTSVSVSIKFGAQQLISNVELDTSYTPREVILQTIQEMLIDDMWDQLQSTTKDEFVKNVSVSITQAPY